MQTVFDSAFTYTTPQVIALTAGASIFFLVIFFAVIKDELDHRNTRHERGKNEWLFTRWDEKLYDTFTKKKPEETLKSLGVDVEKYLKDCAVIKENFPNLKKIAADKLIGTMLVLLSIVVFCISGLNGIVFTLAILLFGAILYQAGIPKIKKQASAKRKQLENELPRFLDLLQTALYINMQVSEAITHTARSLKGTMISDELMATMAETQIAAVSWQEALQEIATKYEVDTFSDFVLYLITGYEKGLNIYDVVSRQAREVRQYQLVSAEENANKVNTAIIIPIAIYKLIPLLFIVGFPIVAQMLGNNSIF